MIKLERRSRSGRSLIGLKGLMLNGPTRVARALVPPAPFEPPAAERAFLDDYALRCMSRRRVGGVLALVIWAAFIGFDLWGGGPDLSIPVALRILGAAILGGGIAISFHPIFLREDFVERLVAAMVMCCWAFLLQMDVVIDSKENYILDALGLFTYMSFISGFTLLRSKAMLVVLGLCLASGAPVIAIDDYGTSIFPRPVSLKDIRPLMRVMGDPSYLMTMCYMTIVGFVGYASATQREREARSAFLRERRLADANLALERSREEVQTSTVALLAAQEDLRALADRKNREKSKFLADAAHDLSQPMHAVSLLIESARHALARGDARKALALVLTSGRAARVARSSFKAVLEISQLESGLVRPTYAAFDLEKLVAEVVAPFRVIAEAGDV